MQLWRQQIRAKKSEFRLVFKTNSDANEFNGMSGLKRNARRSIYISIE